jgi:erythronate-4-phosphate dehydrogenase
MKILADASLPHLVPYFPKPFRITLYEGTPSQDALKNHSILLCRSTLQVRKTLLEHTAINVVATASSGTDHIDRDYLAAQSMALFDAKGSNAEAVADYVIATLAALTRLGTKTGPRAGVIGLGEVGSRVAKRLLSLGFDVMYYDPWKTEPEPYHQATSLTDIATCDVICVHANLHHESPYPSFHLLDKLFFASVKKNAVIINAARGGIVDEDALLQTTTQVLYCTDVYQHEPNIDPRIIAFGTLCTPHIAGHSIEAKQNAIISLSRQLHLHYNIPISHAPQNTSVTEPYENILNWQDWVISIYDPRQETTALKKAPNIADAFLSERRAHTHRHDFAWYARTGQTTDPAT